MTAFEFDPVSNECTTGAKVSLTGWVHGTGNRIHVGPATHDCRIDVRISGNNNRIDIQAPFAVKDLAIRIGNHVPAHSAELTVGSGFSIEGGGQFLLYNSGNRLCIGENCMFSNTVTIRCGDSPHLLFDRVTGEYLDISEGVFVGDHVWVGERVYVTKRASIPSECVVAACSVVTRRFEKQHAVLAGNPARQVREEVQWIRNGSHFGGQSLYKDSYQRQLKKFNSVEKQAVLKT